MLARVVWVGLLLGLWAACGDPGDAGSTGDAMAGDAEPQLDASQEGGTQTLVEVECPEDTFACNGGCLSTAGESENGCTLLAVLPLTRQGPTSVGDGLYVESRGELYRVDPLTGAMQVVAVDGGEVNADSMVGHDGSLFVLESPSIYRIDVDTGARSTVLDDGPSIFADLVASGDYVYWEDDAVYQVPVDGSGVDGATRIASRIGGLPYTADGTHVYAFERDGLKRYPVDDPASPELLLGDVDVGFGAFVDDTYVYWTEQSRHRRLPKAGGSPEQWATGDFGGFQKVFAGHAYYLEGGLITRVSLADGMPIQVARVSDFHNALDFALEVTSEGLFMRVTLGPKVAILRVDP